MPDALDQLLNRAPEQGATLLRKSRIILKNSITTSSLQRVKLSFDYFTCFFLREEMGSVKWLL